MGLDLSMNGQTLPLLIAAALGLLTWYMRSRGVPASVTNPLDDIAARMRAEADRRVQAVQHATFKDAAIEAMDKIAPPDPSVQTKVK